MATSRYSLLRKVGSGGMAEVWKARAADGTGRIVAIKKVLPSLSASPETIDMLGDEARLVSQLKHPNIVQVLDFARDRTDYYIALEYVGGQNLQALQKRVATTNQRLPFEVALYIILEACRALGYAHDSVDAAGKPRNLVHRDVSPHNLLLSWEGEVKVTDFGIAKVADSLSHTQVGTVRGKAAYLAPEQAEMTGLDRRSDLFSLGLVMYELLTGKRLYDALSLPRLIDQIHNFEHLSDAQIGNLPQVIQKILRQVLVREREQRYSNAKEMEAEIASVLDADAAAEAKRALAKILGTLFESEKRMDEGDPTGVGPFPEAEPTRVGSEPGIPAGTPLGGVSEIITLTSSMMRERPTTSPFEDTAPREMSRTVTEPPIEMATDSRTYTDTRPPPERSLFPTLALAAGLLLTGGLAIAMMANFAPPLPASSPAPTGTPIVLATETPALAPSPQETPTEVALATATPLAIESVRPTPLLVATLEASPTPKRTPTPAVAAIDTRPARLWVSARPWVQVFVDGKLAADETPLKAYSFAAGRHTLRFVNPASGFSLERAFVFHAGDDVDLFVDTASPANPLSQQPHR